MSALEGKYVIITGGGRGIGKAIAAALLKSGARVLLISRTKEELEATKKEFRSIAPRVDIFPADVSDFQQISGLRKFIEETWGGRIDILVNAAGVIGPMGSLETLTGEEMADWTKTLGINIVGTAHMSRLVIPFMKRRGGGSIINFSGGGDGPLPNLTAYSTSKGAVLRFTESLAEELRGSHIWVNAIAPGPVFTKIHEEVLRAGPKKVGKEFYEKSMEQKRTGGASPEKAAELILFLVSPRAEGITGKFLSAMWDNFDSVANHKDEIINSDIYTVRRIKPEDRNHRW
ncbi:MAG: SDR family oxidoreductase [Parcubacteria group bacterium]|nr:SDR family oxidoreductase [Parcubacteria group bacterium]